MSIFSIDIEKYHEELLDMGRELKGLFCIQYPIYCIHAQITDSTPDPLDNLDKVIVDFLKVKPDFSMFQIASIIGTSKSLVETRIEKLLIDDLIESKENKYYLTGTGISVFESKTKTRLHKMSYDFYLDGINFNPLPRIFYNYYKSKLTSDNKSYYYTNSKGETKIARPFAPDIVHTPVEKQRISDLILNIDAQQREEYGIPNGLTTIEEISFTKMSFNLLVSVSKSGESLIKELIDGYAIYSLGESHTYYETLRKNVLFFEPQLKNRIQNIQFKLMSPPPKKDNDSSPAAPYLTSNWPETDRYKDTIDRCFNFSFEDLVKFLEDSFGLKHLDQNNIIYEDRTVEINIRKKTLLESPNRQKLINDLIRKRDYRIFNNSLERNVFLFYLYYSTDDQIIKDLIYFMELLKAYQRFPFVQFIEKHPDYSDKIRPYLILAGEFGLLERYDIEKHMINVN